MDFDPSLPPTKMPGIPQGCFYSGVKFKECLKSKHRTAKLNNVTVKLQRTATFAVIFPLKTLQKNKLGFISTEKSSVGSIHSPRGNGTLTPEWRLKFPAFRKYSAVVFTKDGEIFDYNHLKYDNYVFMRWKEHVTGFGSDNEAIFRAYNNYHPTYFFYVCLDKSSGRLESLFYQNLCDGLGVTEENDQSFTARYIEQRSIPVYQLR